MYTNELRAIFSEPSSSSQHGKPFLLKRFYLKVECNHFWSQDKDKISLSKSPLHTTSGQSLYFAIITGTTT